MDQGVPCSTDGQGPSGRVTVAPGRTRKRQGATHVGGDGIVVVSVFLRPSSQGHSISVTTRKGRSLVGTQTKSSQSRHLIDSLTPSRRTRVERRTVSERHVFAACKRAKIQTAIVPELQHTTIQADRSPRSSSHSARPENASLSDANGALLTHR